MERNRRTFEGAQVDEVDLLWDKFAFGHWASVSSAFRIVPFRLYCVIGVPRFHSCNIRVF